MKTHHLIVTLPLAVVLGACAEKADTKSAKEDAEAKARTEALRKEMKEAPKVFSNRDVFKKNEPEKVAPKAEPAPAKETQP